MRTKIYMSSEKAKGIPDPKNAYAPTYGTTAISNPPSLPSLTFIILLLNTGTFSLSLSPPLEPMGGKFSLAPFRIHTPGDELLGGAVLSVLRISTAESWIPSP